MKLVLVEWVDSHSSRDTWTGLDELKGKTRHLHCRTVGWIIEKNKQVLMLASSFSSSERNGEPAHASGDMAIPIEAIKKITILRKS